jgi:hypothetical protein
MLNHYEIEFLTSIVVKIRVFLDVLWVNSSRSFARFIVSISVSSSASRAVVKALFMLCSYKEAHNGEGVSPSTYVSPQQQLNNFRLHFVAWLCTKRYWTL